MLHRGRAAKGVVASLLLVVGGAGACNSVTGADGLTVANGGGSAGGASTTGQGTGGTSHGSSSSGGTSGNTSSGASSGNTSSGGTSSGATSTSSSTSSSSTSTSSGSTDPAQLCVDTINMFRATRSLPPLTRDTSEETCVTGEATTDQMHMTAHWDVMNNNWPCTSNAENECPNWSDNPLDQTEGLVACLTQMWNEKNQTACSGCDTCDFPYTNCTNCVFDDGTTECGHYLNMKSAVLTQVACGFSTGGWYTQDFWP